MIKKKDKSPEELRRSTLKYIDKIRKSIFLDDKEFKKRLKIELSAQIKELNTQNWGKPDESLLNYLKFKKEKAIERVLLFERGIRIAEAIIEEKKQDD